LPLATEIVPGFTTGVAPVAPMVAGNAQFETSLSKCTLYSPLVMRCAESACFPRMVLLRFMLPRIPRVDVLAEDPRFFHPLPSGRLTFGEARG
jgi:hypothetical protein